MEIPSFYEQWRRRHGRTGILRETAEGRPPERLLQAIWSRQRLKRDELRMTDDRPVRVLHPGFWNREAGPDFRGAVLTLGDDAAIGGDVEVDLGSDGWRGHGHDRNPAFANVVLHVVWDTSARRQLEHPTLVIRELLDAPLTELQDLLDGELPPPLVEAQQGRCSAPLRGLEPAALHRLLREAARVRLEARASQLCARARQAGWQQTLIEGVLRALGYKHNAWPLQRIGELAPTLAGTLGGAKSDALHWQALLLGVSGLLPAASNSSTASSYLRRAWDIWWRERDRLAPLILPAGLWRLSGVRPANHPQRRLALAAHWLADPQFFKRLERWFGDVVESRATGQAPLKLAPIGHGLVRALDPGTDPFWSRHWTLRSKPMRNPQPLLGPTRVTDLAVNVILPWFLVRAREGRNTAWSAAAERAWFAWPAAEDNAVLRLARARLLGNARRSVLQTAADQQGLLQITRDFCDHSNAVCKQCRFPDLIAAWAGVGSPASQGTPG